MLAVAGAILCGSCLKDGPLKASYTGFEPVELNDGWEISSPEAEGMDVRLVEKAFRLMYEEHRYPMARSLLVLRNGKIVAEAYPNDPDDIERIQNIQSCTKSFTSILAGIALSNGILDSLDQTFYEIYPEHFDDDTAKREITLRHALCMQTGLEFDDSDHTLELYRSSGSSVEYVLSKRRIYEPGVVFHYNDGAPHLVSAAIQKLHGRPMDEFADEFLFAPLGITDWKWEHSKDGVSFGAFSLFLKPRDIARFGELLLDNGMWKSQQIVDSSWISEASHSWVNAGGDGASYGYYFWIFPGYGGYSAVGHGGQRIFVLPDRRLVVVYTAWPYTSDLFFDDLSEVLDLLVGSCN